MSYESGVIPEFRGEYYFLSNYCYTPFEWRRINFDWSEQAFAYAKTFFAESERHGDLKRKEILAAKSPGDAKRAGSRRGGLRMNTEEWDKRRVQYMREIVHAKFMTGRDSQGHGIVGPLCNTGARMLVEGNDWNDKFWGRCKDADGIWRGLNTLGVILMEERGWWSRGDEGRP